MNGRAAAYFNGVRDITPFFGKSADVFYNYTAIDPECFKKNGLGIDVLKAKASTATG